MTEPYSISNVAHFNNVVPNTSQLESEIIASAIVTTLNRIDRTGDVIDIMFVSAISVGDKIILNGLVSNHEPIISSDSTSEIYDAVVDKNGNGDYLLPSTAFAAGAKRIFIKSGTYNEIADVIVPNNGIMIGESTDQVKFNFANQSYQVKIDGSEGNIENSGTISITNGSQNVIGLGTTFTNLSVGNVIDLDKNYYIIISIISDTSLMLKKIFYGRSLTNVKYVAQPMYIGIYISNITVFGGSGTGLYIRSVQCSNIANVTMCTSISGIEIIDSAMIDFDSFTVQNNPSHGVIINNSHSINMKGGSSYNNGGDGYRLLGNNSNIILNGILASNNTGNGIYIYDTTSEVSINNSTIRNNNFKGIFVSSNNSDIIVDGSLILCNGDDGIQIAGSDNIVSNNIIKMNGDNGIYISLEANDCVINGNICIGNTNDGIILASSNCIITSNRTKTNGGDGCVIVAGGSYNTVKVNRFVGNIGSDFTDNGTFSIKDL